MTLHDRQIARLREYDAYYEGEQPLSYMHPELIQQLEGQVRQVVINWPQLIVDSVEERLNIEGFRRPDQQRRQGPVGDLGRQRHGRGVSGPRRSPGARSFVRDGRLTGGPR